MRLTRDDHRHIALRVINYGMNTNWLLINSHQQEKSSAKKIGGGARVIGKYLHKRRKIWEITQSQRGAYGLVLQRKIWKMGLCCSGWCLQNDTCSRWIWWCHRWELNQAVGWGIQEIPVHSSHQRGIKQMLCKYNHPQSNGKMEKWFDTYNRHRDDFDNIQEFVDWYNRIRPPYEPQFWWAWDSRAGFLQEMRWYHLW